MKTKTISRTMIAVVVMIMTMLGSAACSSTKNVSNTKAPKSKAASPAASYAKKVLANTPEVKALTAKMKVGLAIGDKNVSLSGNLRMKRGDVIQLSMSFPLVGEVCRMEFTTNEVLVVDRINTRYVRASYDQVDFLHSANLDFNVLESIFWNEIFYPGSKDVESHLSEYTISTAGSHTLLSLATAPKLDYAFLTITEDALLDRITVSSKNVSNSSNLVCAYGDFAKFGAGRFPTHMQLTFAGEAKTYGLDISLSSLTANSDWKTRTELSAKYRRIEAEQLFKSLIP